MRTFVLGDIHGAHKALMQVFERSGFDYEKDCLIQLGDVADGWPETAECVEELMKVKQLISIRGNHDVWMQEWLENGRTTDYWTEFGGTASMDSYFRTKKTHDLRHLQFFRKQKNYHVDEKNRLFVHAGYDPAVPISAQSDDTFHFSRNYWNLMKKCSETGSEKPEDVNNFSEVFIGHTQTPKYVAHNKPVNFLHCWNLDQGCKSGVRLSMMNVETKEYVQSDHLLLLYTDLIF